MAQQDSKTAPAFTVTRLKAGVLIDASAVRDPARLDYDAVLREFHQHGAVLVQGLDVRHQEFVDFTERLASGFMEYVGGANNDRDSAFGKSKTVLTVTGGSAAKYAIPLHGEMFHTQPRPRIRRCARTGGACAISRSSARSCRAAQPPPSSPGSKPAPVASSWRLAVNPDRRRCPPNREAKSASSPCVPSIPQNRSCHEQAGPARVNVIIRDGTPRNKMSELEVTRGKWF